MPVINSKPLLPLRDIVVFPSMVVPLFVGREKSIKALQEVMKTDKSIVLVSQKNSEIDEPENKDIYGYGCLSKVLQLLKLPDGTVKVLVEGEKRVRIHEITKEDKNFLSCNIEIIDDTNKTKESELFAFSLAKKFEKLLVLNKRDLSDSINNIKKLKDPSQIADNIASNLNLQIFEKQELLEIIDLRKDATLAEQIEDVVGIPEVDCTVDCVGFEAKGHGHDSVTEQPATVLNAAMEITRAGGGIGIPGLYVTGDPGGVDDNAKMGNLSIRIGLGWAKSHHFHTGQCPVMNYNRDLMQAILYDKIKIADAVNVKVISLDDGPNGYKDFDQGAAKKYVIDPHGMILT